MVKGLYTGYTGMVNSQKRLDVIPTTLQMQQRQVLKQRAVQHRHLIPCMPSRLKMQQSDI